MTSSKKRKHITYCIVVREDRATATDGMYRKFREIFARAAFEICKWTGRQTDMSVCLSVCRQSRGVARSNKVGGQYAVRCGVLCR